MPARLRPLFALFVWLLSAPAVAEPSGEAGSLHGTEFIRYREEVIKNGWTPRETYLPFGDGLEKSWGSALVFYRAGFREVELCAGTGVNPCTFNYVRGADCLRVHTIGEQPEDATVSEVTHECPPDEALARPRREKQKDEPPTAAEDR